MTGPRTLAEHVGPTLHGAAEEAGRPRGAVRVVASLPVSVTDDVDGARAHAADQFAIYGRLPSYRAMLDREDYAGLLAEPAEQADPGALPGGPATFAQALQRRHKRPDTCAG
jgi:alkanesulfonate monooxygenase SsuD/methylene tetrahydromethanopterin reductase-like flavin-dependent oxidoreductase (luciferase family)